MVVKIKDEIVSAASVDMLASGATASVSMGGGTISTMPGTSILTGPMATGGGVVGPTSGPGTVIGTTVVSTSPASGTPGSPVLGPPASASEKAADGSTKVVTETPAPAPASSAAKTKALPKWVAPVAIAALVIVAAIAAYRLWFTGKAAA